MTRDLSTELLDALDDVVICLRVHSVDCRFCDEVLDRALTRVELAMTIAVNDALAAGDTLEAVA